MPVATDRGLIRLNALPLADAEAELMACCAARRWAAAVAAGRPYEDLAALLSAGAAALGELDWADVGEALSAHPRIGEMPRRQSVQEHWSRREQSAMDRAPEGVRAALDEGNRAYEERFGHVFLIRAGGRDAEEMLRRLRERLANDAETERAAVRRELADITDLRLGKLAGASGDGAAG